MNIERMEAAIRKAEVYVGDIMGEYAAQEFGEEGLEMLSSGAWQPDRSEMRMILCESLEMAMDPDDWDFVGDVADYWFRRDYAGE